MKADLSGKVALVTGAARGIGQAIADTFVTNGARVIYTDVADAVHDSAQAHRARALLMDVTNSIQVDSVVRQVTQEFGRLDILVNNAGVNTMQHRVTIDQFPRSEWDRLLSVDLTGVFIVSQAVAQIMRQQASGRIINIASIVGLVPLRLQCAFAAAKAGVVNLTKAMALELGPHGILVNGIAPGSILTHDTRQLFYGEGHDFTDTAQQLLSHVPLGRPGNVDEVAVAALFLAAPENTYTHGHILTVDGGWTAGYTREF